MDGLSLAEFLSTLGSVCGAPSLTFGQLQQAVVWPLDSTKLVDTYTAMLKFLLLHWVSCRMMLLAGEYGRGAVGLILRVAWCKKSRCAA